MRGRDSASPLRNVLARVSFGLGFQNLFVHHPPPLGCWNSDIQKISRKNFNMLLWCQAVFCVSDEIIEKRGIWTSKIFRRFCQSYNGSGIATGRQNPGQIFLIQMKPLRSRLAQRR